MTDAHKTIQYNLRITEELRERLKKSAEIHNRSMNADIVARLEQSFNPQSMNMVNINIGDYLSEAYLKVFEEELRQARQKFRDKYKNATQEDLDKFLANLLEQ